MRTALETAIVAVLSACVGFYAGRSKERVHEPARRLSDEASCASQLESLRWQLDWLQLRSFRVRGPIKLSRCVLPEVLDAYGASAPHYFDGVADGRHTNTITQVPKLAQAYMRYLDKNNTPTKNWRNHMNAGKYEARWSSKLVDKLTALAQLSDPRVAPDDYPYAAAQFYRALSSEQVLITASNSSLAHHAATFAEVTPSAPLQHVRGRDVLVAGSISPWLEAIALGRGAASVSTVDYIRPVTDSRRIRVVTMDEIASGAARLSVDAVFSYSSTPHTQRPHLPIRLHGLL